MNPRRYLSAGVTLIEMIVVIVILGVTMVAIVSLQGQVSQGQTENKDYQRGVQLLQECAEKILAVRRKSGYAAVDASTCNTLPALSGYSARIYTLPAVLPGYPASVPPTPNPSACLSGTTCQLMAVFVSNGANTLGPVYLMLAAY